MVKKSYVHWEDRTILNLCLHKSAVQTNKKIKNWHNYKEKEPTP